jgi:enoyl-CoA hydratase
MSQSILLEARPDGVTVLRLNRPERLNAMDAGMFAAFMAALDEVDADDGCRVLILTGEGRGFCAGLDLSGLSGGLDDPSPLGRPQRLMIAMRRTWTRILPRMRALRPAVIAAVNGPAVGGGFVLALSADIRLAAETALFQDAFAKVGVSGCELGLGWLLPRLVGASRASELMLTGRKASAAEALSMGLVHSLHADHELLDAALAKAAEILANPPFSVWMTRDTLWAAMETPSLQAAIDLENRTQTLCLMTEDGREQLAARQSRREPRYHNR